MSPFLVSTTGIGYEQHAYLWTGFGVWTQLWASTTLPLAWGLGWRAIRDGRHFLAAVTADRADRCAPLRDRVPRAVAPLLVLCRSCAGGPLVTAGSSERAAVLAGSLLAAAWVIVPLVTQRDWAAQNEVLRGTPLANGYGAGRVLRWLCSGQLLDHGRLPVVTLFAALGLIARRGAGVVTPTLARCLSY
jgi:hypothetical protein